MRVCLVSIHPRLLSGQLNSLVGLAGALGERGHQVQLVTAFTQDRLLDRDRIRQPEAKAGVLFAKLARLPEIIWKLRHAAEGADVVQLNLPTPGFSLLGDVVQTILARPIVVGFETHLPSFSDSFRTHVLAAPRFYLPQLTVNNRVVARLSGFRAARYVVASQLQANELIRLGVPAHRTSVIPNVVDLDHVRADFSDDHLPRLAGAPIISYVGHFNHVKGVDVLVRAFPEVLRTYPNALLLLAWSGLGPIGPIERSIRDARIEDRVRLVGPLPLGGILRRSDVLALPYRLSMGQATYPNLLLEAMAAGIPLVTSDLPLFQEILCDGETAELARPEDPVDVGRRLVRLLDDPARRQVMVERQRRLVQRVFHPDLLARRYEAMYEDVVATAHRSRSEAHVLPAPARGGGL
jgi:glycosyltransferase involved in cell wall biosynthesis